MNTLRYFTPVFWAFLLFLLFCFGTGFIILGTVSAVRGDALVFTDPPFQVIEDVTIRSIEGRGQRCLITIKQGGFAGNMAWVDGCQRGVWQGPMRWTLYYE